MGLVNEAKAIAARADHISGITIQGDNAATRAVAQGRSKLTIVAQS